MRNIKKHCISGSAATISSQVLRNVRASGIERLHCCINANGHHFETLAITLKLKKYSMPFKKVEVTLKFSKCLYLEILLAYVIVLLIPYNFCNHNIFHISKNSSDIQGEQSYCPTLYV